MTVEPDDVELLHAWRAGERAAGQALFERHFLAVFRFFANKVPASADDLTQRTFVACVEARDRIAGANLRAYLLGIARRTLLMHLRTQRRWSARFELGDVSIEAVLDSPSVALAEQDEDRLLLAALRRLSFDMQATIELFYWEDLSIAEVAEILEVPPGTIKSRLARARDVIRDALAELGIPEAVRESTVENLDAWARRLSAQLRG